MLGKLIFTSSVLMVSLTACIFNYIKTFNDWNLTIYLSNPNHLNVLIQLLETRRFIDQFSSGEFSAVSSHKLNIFHRSNKCICISQSLMKSQNGSLIFAYYVQKALSTHRIGHGDSGVWHELHFAFARQVYVNDPVAVVADLQLFVRPEVMLLSVFVRLADDALKKTTWMESLI